MGRFKRWRESIKYEWRSVNGYGKTLKGDEEALKDYGGGIEGWLIVKGRHRAALNGEENVLKSDREILKGDEDVFKGDEKVLKGDRYASKSNVEALKGNDGALKGDGVRWKVADIH